MSENAEYKTQLVEWESPQETRIYSYRRLIFRKYIRHRAAVFGTILLVVFVLGAVLGPVLSPYDVYKIEFERKVLPPSLAHPMGTDDLGRDELTRLMAAGRISLGIGLMAAIISVIIGSVIGTIAGYYTGMLDSILMRLTDLMISFPQIFLMMLFSSLYGRTLASIAVVIGSLSWMYTARVVRASFLSMRERDFVLAAHAVGAGDVRIMIRHIFPNAVGPVIVAGTIGVANAIIMESALSYLGLGVQLPAATWGNMLRLAQNQLTTATWLSVFPGLMIVLSVLSINFIGDGLRDALDPYQLLK